MKNEYVLSEKIIKIAYDLFINKEQSVASVAKNLGLTPFFVKMALKSRGINIKQQCQNKIRNTQKICKIVNLYTQTQATTKEIACKYNVCENSIIKLLKDSGVTVPKNSLPRCIYPCDQSYFDNVDTPEKAYFLGFIFGDGHNDLKRTRVNISIQERDREILDYYTKIIQPQKPLYLLKHDRNLRQNEIIMVISGEKICKKLQEYGCQQNKTWHLDYPTFLAENLQQFFIKGMFDSDGCIHLNKQGYLEFSICGTFEMCEGIQRFFFMRLKGCRIDNICFFYNCSCKSIWRNNTVIACKQMYSINIFFCLY